MRVILSQLTKNELRMYLRLILRKGDKITHKGLFFRAIFARIFPATLRQWLLFLYQKHHSIIADENAFEMP